MDTVEALLEAVENFFFLEAMKQGDDLHIVTVGRKSVSPQDFGIKTVEEWNALRRKYLAFILKNRYELRDLLPQLSLQWEDEVQNLEKLFDSVCRRERELASGR